MKPGDLVFLGVAASVQFSADRAIRLRITAVGTAPTYHGWVWLTGYVIDPRGNAVDRREVFVQIAGVQVLRTAKQQVLRTAERNVGQPADRRTRTASG